ncbi:MAG: hypothetical protein SGI74_00590 [Oligoflexia bacterium]|nr:hypothetical protein [Oligoflexia bacterium]
MKTKTFAITLVVPMLLAACGDGQKGHKSTSNDKVSVNNTEKAIDLSKPQRECTEKEFDRFEFKGTKIEIGQVPAGKYEFRSGEVYIHASNGQQSVEALATDSVDASSPELFSNTRLECARSKNITPDLELLVTSFPTTMWRKIEADGKNVNLLGARYINVVIGKTGVEQTYLVKPAYNATTGFPDALKFKPSQFDGVVIYKNQDGSLDLVKLITNSVNGLTTTSISVARYAPIVDAPKVKEDENFSDSPESLARSS